MDKGIDEVVHSARRRFNALAVERRVARILRYALVAAVILLVADKLWRLRFEPWPVVATVVILAIVAGYTLAWRGRIGNLDAALILDEALGLDERLSSAVAVRARRAAQPLREAILTEAERHLADLDLRRALPRTWPGETKVCLALLALALATSLLPRLGVWRSEADRAIELVTRQVGQELYDTARRLERDAAGKDADRVRAQARRVMREALRLRRARMNKEEALRRLERLSQELTAERERLAGHPLRKTGQEARADLRGLGELERDLAEALENEAMTAARELLAEKARQLREGKADVQAARDLAEQLGRAAEALAGSPHQELAEKLNRAAEALRRAAGGSESDRRDAADALDDVADTLRDQAGSFDSQDQLEELWGECQGGKGATGDCERIYDDSQRRLGGRFPDGLCDRYNGYAGRNRGPGSTNEGALPTPSEGAPQQPYQPGDSPPDDSRAEWEQLYAPRRTESLQHDERAGGRLGRGGNVRTTAGPREAPHLSDARVPYYKVIGEYQSQADEALSRGDIPITERQRVKRYFEELREPSPTP